VQPKPTTNTGIADSLHDLEKLVYIVILLFMLAGPLHVTCFKVISNNIRFYISTFFMVCVCVFVFVKCIVGSFQSNHSAGVMHNSCIASVGFGDFCI